MYFEFSPKNWITWMIISRNELNLQKKKIDPDLIFDKCIESLTQRPWMDLKRVKEVQKSRQSNHFTLSFIFILLLEYFMAASSPAPPSSHYKVDARSLFF